MASFALCRATKYLPMQHTSRLLALGLFVGLSAGLTGTHRPDLLGTFAATANDPGYLSFVPASPLYRGSLDLPATVEGVAIETRMPSRILYEDYVDPATRLVNPTAIRRAEADFADLHAAHRTAYCVRETLEDLMDDAPADTALDTLRMQAHALCEETGLRLQDKWEDRNDFAAYRFVETRLAEARRLAETLAAQGVSIDRFNEPHPEAVAFQRTLFDALEVTEALRLEQAGVTERSDRLWSVVSIVRNYLRVHRLEARRPEAANLLVPLAHQATYPGQRFLSPEQVAAFPGDAALLDPPDSGFWRKPTWAIASFRTTDYHRLGVPSLRQHHDAAQFATLDAQVAALLDKEMPVRVVYDRDDLSGRTPKMTVELGDQKWKLKYLTHRRGAGRSLNPAKIYQKRWQGSEVHVEPVVNNLAAALGYTVDPTYYQERVHVYFSDRVYRGTDAEQAARFAAAHDEMIADLTAAFPDANVASALQHVRVDEDGRRYLEIRGGTLEKKSDAATDVNIGYFMRGGFGKSFKREFRAFSLFLAWIADPDIKDANVKAKLVPVPDGTATDYRLVYSASDMGGGLGTGLPNLFPKDLVRGVERDLRGRTWAIDLTYRGIFPAPLLASASFSDARWIARMIGQLTREQIADAFRYAGFPEPVALYYTEILLRRRDQLLGALGLIGETVVDAAGHEHRLVQRSRLKNPKRFRIDGYDAYFRRGRLRDPDQTLFDPADSTSYFPSYWGATMPWHWR